MTLVQLQLLIASTTEQNSDSAAFWSWGGVLAICTGLTLLGLTIDWLLRRRHKDHILLKMSEFQEKLERLPVSDWQMAVARAGLRFWDVFGRLVTRIGEGFIALKQGRLYLFRGLLISALLIMTVPMAAYTLRVGWGVFPWYVEVLGVAISFLSGAVLASGFTAAKLRPNVVFRFSFYVAIHFYRPLAASMLFTTLACAIGVWLYDCNMPSLWYTCYTGPVSITAPFALCLVNFAFDFTTLFVSVHVLRLVQRKARFFVPLAFLDIGISGILTILLHSVLLTKSADQSLALTDAFHIAWDWFIQVVTFSASSTDPNWPLTPILFTTFIPVALYMSAFLFLGILVKPFARTAAYLCGLLWEKKQTPILVFAVTLSGMLTLTKAFSEWRWFVEKLGG